MSFLDVPQGRALAILLPSVTFMAHIATFIVLESSFAQTWGSSWIATYDLLAAAASLVGLLGAVHKRHAWIATYLLAHALTLSLISTLLLINVLPPTLAMNIPYLSHLRLSANFERGICEELDHGFGWDEKWLDDCASSFRSLSKGAMWAGVALMAAQWLVLVSLGGWLRERPSKAYFHHHREIVDVEKRQSAGLLDHKE